MTTRSPDVCPLADRSMSRASMGPVDAVEVLQRVPFLAPASRPSLVRLAERSTWRHLERGQFLFHYGEPANRLYVITDGRVAATATSAHGTQVLFHVATAGEAPGQVDLLHGGNYTASAQALSAVDALVLPAPVCRHLLETEPAALLVFARDLASIVHVLTESLADLVFLDLERRLARLLHDAAANGDRVTLTMTQSELAGRLGVARQSLNQALARLATRGLIVVESPLVVTIVDRAALSTFIKSPLR